MSTRFVLFGLCCIVTVGFVSPIKLPLLCKIERKAQKVKHHVENARNAAKMVKDIITSRQDSFMNNNTDMERRHLLNVETCYSPFGCFEMGEPWHSKLRPVKAPESPSEMHTTIFFYTRENPITPVLIPLYPKIDIRQVKFDPKKKFVIIIHGIKNSEYFMWMTKLKDVYLQEVDANVMIIDWGGKTEEKLYFQIAGDTRLVGSQLAYFVNYLIVYFGAKPEKFHLIGHSLGAHICSYVAKKIPNIGRLTALDPAQLGFEGFDKKVRLDKTDANFVDVVHTDAIPFLPDFGFGMIAPHGHVDFYMNGGFHQPGCYYPTKRTFLLTLTLAKLAKLEIKHLAAYISCSHSRAYMYFTEALNSKNNCTFWGHKTPVSNVFSPTPNHPFYKLRNKWPGVFSSCTKEYCVAMGWDTYKTTRRGSFVVRTNRNPPFCISQHDLS